MLAFKRFNILLLSVLAIVVFSLCLYVYINDPYWLFHDKPQWRIRHNGHNRVLDIKCRFAKSLQILMQKPYALIMGSSRVYRGMPTDRYSDYGIYNLGLSSLRIQEAYGFLAHAVKRAPISEVVIGIDYFMFDSNNRYESGFDLEMEEYGYIFKALSASLISKMAYDDVKLSLSGEYAGDGYWTKSGYKKTQPRSAKEVERVLNTFYNKEQIITDNEYKIFADILEFTNQKKIKTTLFISPLNHKMIARMKEKNQYVEFVQWRNKIKDISFKHDVQIYDFSESNPFYHDPIDNGSTENWIDTSHYSPSTGEWILKEIGFLNKSKPVSILTSKQTISGMRSK